MSSKEKILIVDDELDFYKKIRESLQSTYEIIEASSPAEAKQKITVKDLIPLALVDLNMKEDHDGFEFIDYLGYHLPETVVFAVTQEDKGTTILNLLQRPNVQKVLIKQTYDFESWYEATTSILSLEKQIAFLEEKLDSETLTIREELQTYRKLEELHNKKKPTETGKNTELEKRIEPIQLIENIDPQIYLNEFSSTKDAFFFRSLDWRFSQNVNILLGKNGYGKTFLLRLLLILAHQDSDVTSKDITESFYMSLSYASNNKWKQPYNDNRFYIKREGISFNSSEGKIPVLAIGALRFFPRRPMEGDPQDVDELQSIYFEGSKNFRLGEPEWDRPDILFKLLVKRYRVYARKNRKEISRAKREGDSSFILNIPIFKLTQELINKLTNLNFQYCLINDPEDFSEEEPYLNLGMDILIKTAQHEKPISLRKMSMGSQSILYFFAVIYTYLEFLHHERKLNNHHHEEIEYEHAIVVIDEIDAHLHPDWQQKIVWYLRRTFPNVQFILSAHSPLIVSGCLENEVSILRQIEPGKFNIEQYENNFVGWDVKKLLALVYHVEEKDETYRYISPRRKIKESILEELRSLKDKSERSESEDIRIRDIQLSLRIMHHIDRLEKNKRTYSEVLEENLQLKEELKKLNLRK